VIKFSTSFNPSLNSSLFSAVNTNGYNVYGMCLIHSGGTLEEEPLSPVDKYTESRLGRERIRYGKYLFEFKGGRCILGRNPQSTKEVSHKL
jgi:hypothetical protein